MRQNKGAAPVVPEPEPSKNPVVRAITAITDFLNRTSVQFILYIAFVFVFQLIAESLRVPEEYFFDKFIADTFIDNHFDSSHNTFLSIRRVADVWEWGNNVLWPGIFGNLGPCDGDVVGMRGRFRSAENWTNGTEFDLRAGVVDLAAIMAAKGCTADTWPDGEGSFHMGGAVGWTMAEIVEKMDTLDWTEGIIFRTIRIDGKTDCPGKYLGASCFPELDNLEKGSTASYGFNWTDHSEPLDNPWYYFGADYLGTNPEGQMSAFTPSLRMFEGGGYVAIVIPFLSTKYLPPERGAAEHVTDFRWYALNRTKDGSLSQGVATHFCVRLSWNGQHVHQLCDPNDGENRTTGVVRAAVEEFWNDLKRGHFIDLQTRNVQLVMALRSNNLAVRSRLTMMLETTSLGSVLPSYDTETSVEVTSLVDNIMSYTNVAFAMTITFILLEALEVMERGAGEYFSDLWNVMDWLNFFLFFITYSYIFQMVNDTFTKSQLCLSVGYCDDYQMMGIITNAKLFLSFCICIQLLKIVKFTDTLVPKMNLATSVLRAAGLDLLFFAFVFIMSLTAFGMMFYVQLGPVMDRFNTKHGSLISLSRALFGDFDIDDILNNSKDYLNALFFLVYLFVAVFILLSMFLTILGEHQAAVRDDQTLKKESGEAPPEYGVLADCSSMFGSAKRAVLNAAGLGEKGVEVHVSETNGVAVDGAIVNEPYDAYGDGYGGGPAALRDLRHDISLLTAQVQELAEADLSGRRLEAALAAALEARLLPLVSRAIDERLAGGVPSAIPGINGGAPEATLKQQAALGSAGAAFLALTSEERKKRRGERRCANGSAPNGGTQV